MKEKLQNFHKKTLHLLDIVVEKDLFKKIQKAQAIKETIQ